MTRLGIEPRSPGPLVNTLLIGPIWRNLLSKYYQLKPKGTFDIQRVEKMDLINFGCVRKPTGEKERKRKLEKYWNLFHIVIIMWKTERAVFIIVWGHAFIPSIQKSRLGDSEIQKWLEAVYITIDFTGIWKYTEVFGDLISELITTSKQETKSDRS